MFWELHHKKVAMLESEISSDVICRLFVSSNMYVYRYSSAQLDDMKTQRNYHNWVPGPAGNPSLVLIMAASSR